MPNKRSVELTTNNDIEENEVLTPGHFLIGRPPLEVIDPINENKTRKNDIVEYLDYQIPVTQLKGPKKNGDMKAAKRD